MVFFLSIFPPRCWGEREKERRERGGYCIVVPFRLVKLYIDHLQNLLIVCNNKTLHVLENSAWFYYDGVLLILVPVSR